MTITNLSLNPANNDTLEGAFRHILNKMIASVDNMLPAKVISYDREKNRATVQPLIKVVTTDGSNLSRAQINNIPVLLLGGGGYFVSFPLKPGNLGWILASDRDISIFTQNYSDSVPNTFRKKDFADSIFIPDAMTGYTFDGSDSENLVIQSLSGDTKISLGNNSISIIAENINIEGETSITGDVTIEGNISVTGDLNVDGNETITGNLTVSGSITGNGGMNLTGNLAVIGNITATGTITPGV